MSWATVLKAGLKFMGRGAQATVKTVGHTALHPQQTIKGLGTATKTAAVGTAAGYVAWEKLTTDKRSTVWGRRWKESVMQSAV